MTNVDALRKCMDESGMKIVSIAKKSGMLRETLYNRLKTGDFKISEICALSSALNLSKEKRDEIFLEIIVNKIHYYK